MADDQGSVVAVLGGDGGVLGVNTYSVWGIGGGTRLGRFGYTGQAWLAEAGLYHYKARIYSPTLGRFLQPDPVGTADDLNLYAYVGNDPVNDADSTGMWADRGKGLGRNILNWGGQTAYNSMDMCGIVCAKVGPVGPYNGGGRLITPGGPVSRFAAMGKGVTFLAPFAASAGAARAAPLANFNWAQTTASGSFSLEGAFAGQTINSLSASVRSGAIAHSQIPINYVVRQGVPVVANTRSALVLLRAGVPVRNWSAVNQTGLPAWEARVGQQLLRNRLPNYGTPTAPRVTGSGG